MNIKKRKEKLKQITKEALRDTSTESKISSIQNTFSQVPDPNQYAHDVFNALVDSIVDDMTEGSD